MEEFKIYPGATALVVIDLQKGISLREGLSPHSGKEVIENSLKLVEACREKEIPVVLVHVKPNQYTALKPEADSGMNMGNLPENWADFVPEMTPKEKDIIVTKHQWGAFYGTQLDMELRRRGIRTIILCGISTNIGVESTARDAFELGYNQIFPEDAMTAMNEEGHNSSVKHIFPRIGKVRSTDEVLEALKSLD